jgi:hypothetical protein
MNITFSSRELLIESLILDTKWVNFVLPPATGTHAQCFSERNYGHDMRRAIGKEIVAYATACFEGQGEWRDQERVKFPDQMHLRFPFVLTMIPITENGRFGDLEGAMLCDLDYEGLGSRKKVEIPTEEQLAEWKYEGIGVYTKGLRSLVTHKLWDRDSWNEYNGALIVLCGGIDATQALSKIPKGSGRDYRPIYKINPREISCPVKILPALTGHGRKWLGLDLRDTGHVNYGCAARVWIGD